MPATGKRGGFSERRHNEENPSPKRLRVQEGKSVARSVLRQSSVAGRDHSTFTKSTQIGRGGRRISIEEGGARARGRVSGTFKRRQSDSPEHDDADAVCRKHLPTVCA